MKWHHGTPYLGKQGSHVHRPPGDRGLWLQVLWGKEVVFSGEKHRRAVCRVVGRALGSLKTVPSERKPSNELALTRVRVSRFQTQFLWVLRLRFAYGSHPFPFCCSPSPSAPAVPSPSLCPRPVPSCGSTAARRCESCSFPQNSAGVRTEPLEKELLAGLF